MRLIERICAQGHNRKNKECGVLSFLGVADDDDWDWQDKIMAPARRKVNQLEAAYADALETSAEVDRWLAQQAKEAVHVPVHVIQGPVREAMRALEPVVPQITPRMVEGVDGLLEDLAKIGGAIAAGTLIAKMLTHLAKKHPIGVLGPAALSLIGWMQDEELFFGRFHFSYWGEELDS